MFWSICWRINIYFLGHFLKGEYIPSLVVVSFAFRFPWQKRSKVNCFDLAGLSCSQFRADSRIPFPSLIIHSCIEIQYGRQQIVFSVRKFPPPQQDLFKKMVSSIAFLNCPWVFYMFSEKIGTANLYLLSPSNLVQFSPDKHHLNICILARQAMKVAGETWQRSRQTSPAAGSYIQPCGPLCDLISKRCLFILTDIFLINGPHY